MKMNHDDEEGRGEIETQFTDFVIIRGINYQRQMRKSEDDKVRS